MPRFDGSPSLALREESGVACLDIAISPAGLIYVLSTANGAEKVGDHQLDVYLPGGEVLSRTAGVCGARIAVDSAEAVYTLNFQAITVGGRKEPSISQWIPTTE